MTAGVPALTGPTPRPHLPPPSAWYGKYWACERYDCAPLQLPGHTHVQVTVDSGAVVESAHIDRVFVDWRAVAYRLWTGREPVAVGQLALNLEDNGG